MIAIDIGVALTSLQSLYYAQILCFVLPQYINGYYQEQKDYVGVKAGTESYIISVKIRCR